MSTLEMSRLEMFILGLENYGGRGGPFHSAKLSISQLDVSNLNISNLSISNLNNSNLDMIRHSPVQKVRSLASVEIVEQFHWMAQKVNIWDTLLTGCCKNAAIGSRHQRAAAFCLVSFPNRMQIVCVIRKWENDSCHPLHTCIILIVNLPSE